MPRARAGRPATFVIGLAGFVAVALGAWRAGTAAAAGAGPDLRPAGPARGAAPSSPTPAPPVASPHGNLEVRCEACHTTRSWTAMRDRSLFDHAGTGFPLEGKHAVVQCQDCHASKVFSRVATSCVDCHRDVHEGRRGPRCQDCHTPQRWTVRADALRKHAGTGFPLRGVHALLECSRCHGGSGEANIARLSSDCVSCHSADYASTRSPNHASAGYSTRCETCHDAARSRWRGAGFEHASTGFALTGAHRGATCETCHKGGNFTALSTDCQTCHQAAYAATRNPAHAPAGFSTQCAGCHGTTAWAGAAFDHNKTGFALTGAHRPLTCADCHFGGRFAGTPADCYACHQSTYGATSNPAHAAAGFGTNCSSCHTPAGWRPANFDHDGMYFRIYSGTHRGKWSNCAQCHQNTASYADFTCFSCHAHDQSWMDSSHLNRSGYRYESTACYACHRGV